MTDLPAQLRALADRVADLEPAQVVGELEALKFAIWTTTIARPAASGESPTAPMLSTRDAARLLGISATALRRLVAAHEVPVVRFGRRVLFRRETLERLRTDREGVGGR